MTTNEIEVPGTCLEPRGSEADADRVDGQFPSQNSDFPMSGPGDWIDGANQATGTRRGYGGASPEVAAQEPVRRVQEYRRRGEVVVLLPALNEEGAIGGVIDRIPGEILRSRGYQLAVWVVDGQSSDRTMELARSKGATTFVQSGRGKGNGMRQALRELASRSSGETDRDHRLFIMLDADGTYPPEDILRFVDALESGNDVVLGSRLCGSIARGAMSEMNLLGNRLLSTFASLLFRVPVSDVCTGMWGFRETALRGMGLVATGFDLEADFFASACAQGVRLRELPIPYDRRIGEPKLVPLRTGVTIAWRLLMRRLNRRAVEPPAKRRTSIGIAEEAA